MAIDLSNIDTKNINWEELETEVSRDILQGIRNLSSDNLDIRASTLDTLFDNIYHQGDLCYDSVFVTPFLIERLNCETEYPLLSRILYSLAALATSNSLLDSRIA